MIRFAAVIFLAFNLIACTDVQPSHSSARWSLGSLPKAECEAKDGLWRGVEGAETALCIRKASQSCRTHTARTIGLATFARRPHCRAGCFARRSTIIALLPNYSLKRTTANRHGVD